MRNLKPYDGNTKLVVAFDIGTTFSGISYCILERGQVPEIHGVTRFPGQAQVSGDAKVPSLLYYDKSGSVRAAGPKVLTENVTETALTEGWTKAEWWKLHLRPKHLASSINKDDDLPPLPPGISAVRVLTDFIKYLFQCAKTYILEHHLAFPWSSVEDSIEYIFTHPNGWEGIQQQLYRRAIVSAGLVPSVPEGQSRIHLLTEGEASLHFCVANLVNVNLTEQATQGVVIIDAGGVTVDLSVFSMTSNPISCEEMAPAECRLQGAVFVTRRAKILIEKKLEGWEHSTTEEIAEYTREFDKSTKLVIKSDKELAFVRVAGRRTNLPRYNISFGKLKLTGEEATGLFNESYDAIIGAFEQQQKSAKTPITMAFLVGGLSTNDWLWSRLKSYFEDRSINICRPDNHINKAVANGAVLSHVDRENHKVTSRVARAIYGVVCALPVKSNDKEHIRRKSQWEIDPTGERYVPNYFEAKLFRGDKVPEEMEFRESFSLTESNPAHFSMQIVRLECYRGSLRKPKWVDEDRSSFFTFCTICTDLSQAVNDLTKKRRSGEIFYQLDYDVIVYFGLTELRAYLSWKTKDGERRVLAVITFDDTFTADAPSHQAGGFKQPRKVFPSETSESKAQSAPTLDNGSGSMDASGISVLNESPPPASKEPGQDIKQSDLREYGEGPQNVTNSPEKIYYNLEPDASSGTVVSGPKQTGRTVTTVTTTTTKVEERKNKDNQQTGLSTTVGGGTMQPRPTFSQTTTVQQRYETQSYSQGGLQRKASFYIENRAHTVSSTSGTVEPRRSSVSSRSTSAADAPSGRFKQPRKVLLSETSKSKTQSAPTLDNDSESTDTSGMANATAIQENERLWKEIVALQNCYDALSKKHDSVLDDLRESKILVEEKDRTITTFTSGVDKQKDVNATMTKQLDTERHEKEKLQQDVAALSYQVANLQACCDVQSKEIVSLRTEVRTKATLLAEKEHHITSLTIERDQARREGAVKAGLVATARRDTEQLWQKLTDAWDQNADLHQRFDAQLIELNNLHTELGRTKIFTNKPSADVCDRDVAEYIARAQEGKEKQIDALRRVLAAATSRNNDFQKSHEALSTKINALSDELKMKASQCEGAKDTITALTAQVNQLRATDAGKAEAFTNALNQARELQLEVTTFTAQSTELEGRYALQSKVLISASNQLQMMSLSNQEKDCDISSLTAERDQQVYGNATKAEQIAKLQQELSTSHSQLTEFQDSSKTRSDELTAASSRIASLEQELGRWLRLDASKSAELAATWERLEELQRNLDALQSETKKRYEESNALKAALAESQSQLRGVQRVVATADTYVDETIISMLEKLNEEVRQNTTYMAEGMAEDFQPRTTKATERVSATQNISHFIGETLANYLTTMDHNDAMLYLPIAFQAYFSYYLCWAISSWTTEKGHNDFINEIYERLQKSETQPMSGRWRALTRAYISPTWMSKSSSITQEIMADLSDILVVARCAASATPANSKLSSFKDKIISIISTAGQFSEMIGKVVSADFTVVAPPPLQVFEEATMEPDVDDYDYDPWKAGRKVAVQKVLCPTRLGMTKRMQRESGKETLTVMKAKVVLESFLDG